MPGGLPFIFSVQSFNLAKHLNTAPELVHRAYNRPTLETLETKSIQGSVDPKSLKVCVWVWQRWFTSKYLAQRLKSIKNIKNPCFGCTWWLRSFFFLLQTVEDGDNEETPVQEPQPEDWQRKENVCYLTKDSDSQRPSGEEQSSVSAPRLNWLSVFALWSTTSFYFVPQDKTKKVKVKNETANSAAIYKFEARRKRWETFPEWLHRQSLWHRGHAHHRDISFFQLVLYIFIQDS